MHTTMLAIDHIRGRPWSPQPYAGKAICGTVAPNGLLNVVGKHTRLSSTLDNCHLFDSLTESEFQSYIASTLPETDRCVLQLVLKYNCNVNCVSRRK